MTGEESYHYWAFISYSSKDADIAKKLHKRLETYRIPRDLVGRPGRDEPVPRRLFPIFRDREELPLSSDLGSSIEDALRASRYLIVLCSPHAAASRWVNEEIRFFKSLGREDRILALIVDGEPNATDIPGSEARECFPHYLRYRFDSGEQPSNERIEPIGGDLRPGGDGWATCFLKAAAGIIGVSLDSLVKRQRRRERRKRIVLGCVAVAMIAIGLTVAMMITSAKAETKVEQEKANRLVQLFLPEGRNAPDIIYGSTVGDLALVKSTLDDGVDVNMRWGELGQTPLMYAAMGGHTNICEFLIDHGADPSLYDRGMDSSAPIHHAAEWGRDDVIRYFASIGENLDRPTQQNFRPIDVAAYSGQAESIKTFVELGISLYSSSADESDYQLSSPLGIAIWNNQTDSVSMLLELGIKVHPQHLEDAGVAHCEIRLLRLLLDKSSDRSIEILTRMLRGLCHMSQYREHSLESARYLLDQGADPNRRAGYARFVSHKGDSPIDQAIDNVTLHWDTSADYPGRQDAALALLDLLLEYGGNIDQLVFEIASGGNASLLDRVPESNLRRYNQRGEMPIHIAARGNRSEVIQYLLDAGLDVDAPPRPDSRVLGSTPLSFAVGADSVEAAQILIKNGANVNALESNSVLARNLLYVAIRTSKDGRMVKLLIDSGMPPEGLHAAVSYLANPSAVRILIAAGADLQAKNDAGRTPLEEAMAYKSSNESKQVAIAECVQLLREAEGKE